MLSNQCISITDLRTKTKECLEGLWKQEKYVFVNNKPVAVLMDVEMFEKWDTVVDFGEEGIDVKKLLTVHKRRK